MSIAPMSPPALPIAVANWPSVLARLGKLDAQSQTVAGTRRTLHIFV
jgi:hypothetical protein